MKSYFVDVLRHGCMWAVLVILFLRQWRGGTCYATVGLFFWLAFVYGSIR